jgi:nicotinamide riboside kinase
MERRNRVIKIAFAGPPSSGKTMLARLLSVILKQIGCWADMVNEAHRPYLVRNVWPENRQINAKDQYTMFCNQIANESEYETVQSDYVFYEMPFFNDLIWLKFKGLDASEEGKTYKELMEIECQKHSYDLIFLCSPNNVPNVRQRVNEEDRIRIYDLTKEFVMENKPYKTEVFELESGEFAEKASLVLEILSKQYKEIGDKLSEFRKNNKHTLYIP